MIEKIKSEKMLTFFFLILSSLGFSTGIVTTKIFSDSNSLAYILKLQSVVVFTSFILQLGLRAALRVQIYSNRKRLAKITYDYLYVFLSILSILAFISELYFSKYLFFTLSSLLAIVTLNLTLSVASNVLKSIVIFGFITFLVAFSGSLILLLVDDIKMTSMLIELISLIVLISLYRVENWSKIYKYRKKIIVIYWNAQSYQLGSCVVALFIFLLTQSAVLQFKDGTLNAYSDALIFSGFIVLFIGQIMLLFERKLYKSKSNKYFLYILMIIIHVFISAIFSFIASYIYNTDWVLMMSVVFILLSRTTAGYIVQYIELKRDVLNCISGVFFLGYLIFYFFGFKNFDINYHIYPVILYLFLGFVLLKRESN